MSRVVLPPSSLGLTEAEHKALLEIRELFASGGFQHDPEGATDKANGFNMNFPLDENKCGTTGCIGGWMYLAMERDRTTQAHSAGHYVNHMRSHALKELFYPPQEEIGEVNYDDITPGAALKAIDGFLAGQLDWADAVGANIGEIEHA